MLDKLKKNLFLEISNLKEENKKVNNKNKQLEEKIEIITKDLNNENNALKEKINTLENKTNDLEQELKNKNKEIEILKNQVNDLILTNKKITLKFKISGEGINEVISINTNGEAKLSEVLSLLYELCPGINDLNIKGFCIEGKENEKIDEMKTVNENKLVNDSLILLIV
jgi:predicted RNase H-like nuclease (RuvC/YqgF family)